MAACAVADHPCSADPPSEGVADRGCRDDPPVVGPGSTVVDEPDVWRSFGQAVLGFHFRVWQTAMCQCGRTVVECDVMAQARTHGLLPPLPA